MSHIALGTFRPIYFSLCATPDLGSVLFFSLPPRAVVQLAETGPAAISPTRSPGTQWGAVHVRD